MAAPVQAARKENESCYLDQNVHIARERICISKEHPQ